MQKVAVCIALAGAISLPAAAMAEEPRGPSEAQVVASVGLDFGGRRFAYSDALTPNLRDYQVFGAPMPNLGVELYPLMGLDVPFLRDVGVGFRYGHALGLDSETSAGTVVGTSWSRGSVFLRARMRPGDDRRAMLGLSVGAGFERFAFGATGELGAEVPSVSYALLRAALDARMPLWGRAALLTELGYAGVLSSGTVGERFRDARAGGLELGLGLSVPIAAGFEAQVEGRYTRYFHAFSPEPGDTYIAGGALDEFLTLGLKAVYAY